MFLMLCVLRTEVGAITKDVMPSGRALYGEWEYFAMTPVVDHVRVYQDDQPGVFELVIMVWRLFDKCTLTVCSQPLDRNRK